MIGFWLRLSCSISSFPHHSRKTCPFPGGISCLFYSVTRRPLFFEGSVASSSTMPLSSVSSLVLFHSSRCGWPRPAVLSCWDFRGLRPLDPGADKCWGRVGVPVPPATLALCLRWTLNFPYFVVYWTGEVVSPSVPFSLIVSFGSLPSCDGNSPISRRLPLGLLQQPSSSSASSSPLGSA